MHAGVVDAYKWADLVLPYSTPRASDGSHVSMATPAKCYQGQTTLVKGRRHRYVTADLWGQVQMAKLYKVPCTPRHLVAAAHYTGYTSEIGALRSTQELEPLSPSTKTT